MVLAIIDRSSFKRIFPSLGMPSIGRALKNSNEFCSLSLHGRDMVHASAITRIVSGKIPALPYLSSVMNYIVNQS